MSSEGSGATRAGGDEFHNEDAFVVEEGLGLYVVCDGAGGQPAGELAARVASRALEEFVERAGEDFEFRSEQVKRVVVERAMAHAMDALAEAGAADPNARGLETTATMLLAHGKVGVIGHHGDSRAYLIRRRNVQQLTIDHELTDESADGGTAGRAFDVFSLDLRPGDIVVLCTDGAEDVLQDEAIARVASELSPRILASRIVSEAHRRSPNEDATAVVVRVRDDRERGWLELSVLPRGTAFGHTIPLAARPLAAG